MTTRKPTDATLRNARASQRRDDALTRRIARAEAKLVRLAADMRRVKAFLVLD
jgi:hypothetical protein